MRWPFRALLVRRKTARPQRHVAGPAAGGGALACANKVRPRSTWASCGLVACWRGQWHSEDHIVQRLSSISTLAGLALQRSCRWQQAILLRRGAGLVRKMARGDAHVTRKAPPVWCNGGHVGPSSQSSPTSCGPRGHPTPGSGAPMGPGTAAWSPVWPGCRPRQWLEHARQ